MGKKKKPNIFPTSKDISASLKKRFNNKPEAYVTGSIATPIEMTKDLGSTSNEVDSTFDEPYIDRQYCNTLHENLILKFEKSVKEKLDAVKNEIIAHINSDLLLKINNNSQNMLWFIYFVLLVLISLIIWMLPSWINWSWFIANPSKILIQSLIQISTFFILLLIPKKEHWKTWIAFGLISMIGNFLSIVNSLK